MKRAALRILVALVLVGTFPRHTAAQRDDVGAPRATAPLTILQLNDVYSTAPVADVGGLARVATL